MKIIPTRDNVLVKPCYEKKSSVIVVNDKKSPMYYHVIGVGDKVTTVAYGDKVVLTDFGGKHLNIDGNEYIVLKEDAILAKIKE